MMRPFLPDMGKKTGDLAANFCEISNFYVANVKIGDCCISMQQPLLRCLSILDGFSGTKQKGNAPKSRQRDDRVDDAADQGVLSAEDPRYKVKLEQADAAPVHSTDDNQ